jgi:hypothetical protein
MLHVFRNPLFARPTALVLLLSLSFLSFVRHTVPVTLNAGTAIPLELTQAINSSLVQAGQTIDFRVRTDIKVGDQVVVPAGSIAKGLVTRAERAKGLGKEGYVEVQIKSVTAVDGQQVVLAGNSFYREGEDKQTLSIVLGVLVCLLFLTMKGKNAEIPAGTPVDATTASNTDIEVK